MSIRMITSKKKITNAGKHVERLNPCALLEKTKLKILWHFCKILKVETTLCVCVCVCTRLVTSVVSNSAIPWTVARQAPLSVELSRQEYWSGLPCSPPGDLPNSRTNPGLPHCRRILYHLSPREAQNYNALSHFSHVRIFATPWYSPPGSSVHGILQARILQ